MIELNFLTNSLFGKMRFKDVFLTANILLYTNSDCLVKKNLSN